MEKKAKTYIRFSSPGLRIGGLKRIPERLDRNIRVASFRVDSPDVQVRRPDGSGMSASLKDLALEGVSWDSTLLKLGSVHMESPVADIYSGHFLDTLQNQTKLGSVDLYTALEKVAGRIFLGRFSLKDANIRYAYYGKSDSLQHQKLDTTNLFIEGLAVDTRLRTYKLDYIRFSTRNLELPLDNGFYTLKVGAVDLTGSSVVIDRIRLISPYPKMQFAYLQPHHKDWFDVSVGQVALAGIDLSTYLSEKVLRIADVQVSDAVLQNFKNQKIPVSRRIVPMIYTGFRRLRLSWISKEWAFSKKRSFSESTGNFQVAVKFPFPINLPSASSTMYWSGRETIFVKPVNVPFISVKNSFPGTVPFFASSS